MFNVAFGRCEMREILQEELKKIDTSWNGEFDGEYMGGIDKALLLTNEYRFGVTEDGILVINENEMQQILSKINHGEAMELINKGEYIRMFEANCKYSDLLFPAFNEVLGISYDCLYVNSFDVVLDKISQK